MTANAVTIDVLNTTLCVSGSFASLSRKLACIELVGKNGPVAANAYFNAPQPKDAMVRSVTAQNSSERGCCPGRHPLRFTIYRLSRCCFCLLSKIPFDIDTADCLGDIGPVRT